MRWYSQPGLLYGRHTVRRVRRSKERCSTSIALHRKHLRGVEVVPIERARGGVGRQGCVGAQGAEGMGAAPCVASQGGLGAPGGVAEQRSTLAGGRWFLGIWINHYNRRRQGEVGQALRAETRGCEERHGSVEKSSGRRKIKTLPNKDYTGEIKDIKGKPTKTLRTSGYSTKDIA